jgi:nitric oxide dioxygenase
MTPAQVRLVQDSFQAFAPNAFTASAAFYDELFRLAPDVRPLFPQDLRAQRRKLIDTLTAVVNGLTYPDALMPTVRKLGARHAGYAARAPHYDAVGQALLATLATTLGERFTPEVKAAWLACYGLLSREMQAAA